MAVHKREGFPLVLRLAFHLRHGVIIAGHQRPDVLGHQAHDRWLFPGLDGEATRRVERRGGLVDRVRQQGPYPDIIGDGGVAALRLQGLPLEPSIEARVSAAKFLHAMGRGQRLDPKGPQPTFRT